jgi:hypothetical protein
MSPPGLLSLSFNTEIWLPHPAVLTYNILAIYTIEIYLSLGELP